MTQEVINDTIQEHFLELKTIKWQLEGAHRNRRNKHITVKFLSCLSSINILLTYESFHQHLNKLLYYWKKNTLNWCYFPHQLTPYFPNFSLQYDFREQVFLCCLPFPLLSCSLKCPLNQTFPSLHENYYLVKVSLMTSLLTFQWPSSSSCLTHL